MEKERLLWKRTDRHPRAVFQNQELATLFVATGAMSGDESDDFDVGAKMFDEDSDDGFDDGASDGGEGDDEDGDDDGDEGHGKRCRGHEDSSKAGLGTAKHKGGYIGSKGRVTKTAKILARRRVDACSAL